MYINFKSKYKKIFWVLFGFLLSCVFVHKVYAYNYNGLELNQDFFNTLWTSFEGKTPRDFTRGSYASDYVYHQADYPYVECTINYNYPTYYFCSFYKNIYYTGTSQSNNRYSFYFGTSREDAIRFTYITNTRVIETTNYSQKITSTSDPYYNYYWSAIYTANSSYWGYRKSVSNFDIPGIITSSFEYVPQSLPSYLQGYKKITLTTDDKYYMLSGLSSGSVYVPTQAFEDYGGRLSFYDNDLTSQPYTSYIQDYYKMPDGEFIRQDFDLSQFYGADWVMFSKYIYLEGEDDISYAIYVPNDIYDSAVTITPNTSTGGNDFDFEYKDENGDIQNEQVQSVDLSQDNPLLGNIFSDFSSNTFGLTSIITAPLSLIRSLSSTSCTPLNIPLPFVGGTLTLPCMYSFYSSTFGSLFTLYQTITFGVVAYWVMVRIFNLVKDFKNPDHDEIEVIDL